MLSSVLAEAVRRASAALDETVLRRVGSAVGRNDERAAGDPRMRMLELARAYGDDTLGLPSRFFPEPPVAEVTSSSIGPGPEGSWIVDLSFASEYRPFLAAHNDEHLRLRENLVAHARWFVCQRERPTMIILHGWGGGAYWLEERVFAVSYWLAQGFNVALFQLPHHGRRVADRARSGALFIGPHLVRTNEAMGQAIHDLRALARHLRREGSPAVGVVGMSLGGYVAALWATVVDDLAFAIPIAPAVKMSTLVWRHGADNPALRAAAKDGVTEDLIADVFRVHAPITRPVRLPRERLLIVAGRADRVCPPEQAQTLRAHWGGCEIHWWNGGHLAQIGRSDAFRAMRRHLDRLDLPGRDRKPP